MKMNLSELIETLDRYKELLAKRGIHDTSKVEVRLGLESYRAAPALDFVDSENFVNIEDGKATVWFNAKTAQDYCPTFDYENLGEIVCADESDEPGLEDDEDVIYWEEE